MVAVELMVAFFTAEQWFDFVKLKHSILHERAVLLHDVKTEPHVVAAVAGERIAADSDELDGIRLLRDGLAFDRLDDGAD
jgi:hypothetical protein